MAFATNPGVSLWGERTAITRSTFLTSQPIRIPPRKSGRTTVTIARYRLEDYAKYSEEPSTKPSTAPAVPYNTQPSTYWRRYIADVSIRNAPNPSELSARTAEKRAAAAAAAKPAQDTAYVPLPVSSSKPSSFWRRYLQAEQLRNAPYPAVTKAASPGKGRSSAPSVLFVASTPFFAIEAKKLSDKFGAGGDPEVMMLNRTSRKADAYMGRRIAASCKMSAVPNGLYGTRCAEGGVKGQAEVSRTLALAREFRMKQRPSNRKFGDMYATRRSAVNMVNGCSYEESLVCKNPASARVFVRASREALASCSRYVQGADKGERYMADAVEKTYKSMAVPMGVYDVLCNDGSVKGMAEARRVSALGVEFRAKQMSTIEKERVKFDARKYARDNYAHMCSYEENLFNRFPAVAAYMRPPAETRY